MLGEGLPDSRAVAWHDIEYAVGKACFLDKLCELERRQRRHFGRLQYDDIASRKCGSKLPACNLHYWTVSTSGEDNIL